MVLRQLVDVLRRVLEHRHAEQAAEKQEHSIQHGDFPGNGSEEEGNENPTT